MHVREMTIPEQVSFLNRAARVHLGIPQGSSHKVRCTHLDQAKAVRPCSDEACSDEACSDETCSDEAYSDKACITDTVLSGCAAA